MNRAVLVMSCVLGLVAAGCSDSSSTDDTPSAGTTASSDEVLAGGDFEVFPPKVWSGFDGMHTYKAPIIAVNTSGEVSWSIQDPSIATITPDPQDSSELLIVTKASGETMITATSGGQSMTVPLVVIAYTQAQYAAGEARYNTAANDDNPACKKCHAPGKGPDHTATELDADPDEEIESTFLSGVDPEGRPISEESEFAYLLEGKDHTWEVTETERVGLLAYLRALEPMGYPVYDEPTTQK